MYLLDTNAWIAYLNPGQSPVVSRMRTHQASELFLCSVVRAELFYGAYKSPQSNSNLRLLKTVCGMFPTLPFDDRAAEHYGQIRAAMERTGNLVGPNDMLIASIARANSMTVVTHDVEEFSMISGLPIEDWELSG
jgi:tRNA(fMet)-specific endonuclease VapC